MQFIVTYWNRFVYGRQSGLFGTEEGRASGVGLWAMMDAPV